MREEVTKRKKRKVRSDKKRDVKPTVCNHLKDCIYRLSYITNTPVKDVSETLCQEGLRSGKVIDYLSIHFRRDLQHLNTIYMGDSRRESLQRRRPEGSTSRLTIRFTPQTYENIYSLSTALDVTPSKATALLLDASVRNVDLLNTFVKDYVEDQIDEGRMKELRQVLKYINKNNPYDEEVSWFSLLSMIMEEFKDSSLHIKDRIYQWMDRYR